MIRYYYLLLIGIISIETQAQIADWENYSIDSLNYIKDSGTVGYFESGGIRLNNNYVADPVFPYWSGWILSNSMDVTSPGFMNEHSAITGSGVNNSENYAVTYIYGESLIHYDESPGDKIFKGMYVTNSTYAYLSMLNGDNIAKKFGGETGDDPDFFMLTIKGYENGVLATDSINVMLADYRFDDNVQDYILDDWQYVDLKTLAGSDSISLILTSSDVGVFGMNTPAYVCLDNVEWDFFLSTEEVNPTLKTHGTVISSILKLESPRSTDVVLVDRGGAVVMNFEISSGINDIDVADLPSGVYYVKDITLGGSTFTIIKI